MPPLICQVPVAKCWDRGERGKPRAHFSEVYSLINSMQGVQLSDSALSVPNHLGGPYMMKGVYSCNTTPPPP